MKPAAIVYLLFCWLALSPVTQAQETATVTVDRHIPDGVSHLSLGVTHTQYSLDTGGDPAAVARGKALLSRICRYQNAHIMGWGEDNPNPAPGIYHWETLDRRIALIRSMPGAVPVITLCAAPDWMKGGQPNTTDWSRIEAAPLPEHYADFAALAKKIAQRYPDVQHYQVWNEFKGLWDAPHNNWDYVRYTELYNAVYDALKSVNPNIKVGGPYLVIEGTGSDKSHNWTTDKPIRARQWEVLNYWLQHKHGADFIVLDRGIKDFHDTNAYTLDERMALTSVFEQIARQVRAKTNLPLWWAEYYAETPTGNKQALAALHASVLLHMLKGGTAAALLWQPMETGEVEQALFTDARKPGGGRPLPYALVFQAFHDDFGPGTRLYQATSSSPGLEALASATKILLINKRSTPIIVNCEGHRLTLAPYDVRVLPTVRGK